jgi:cytosine/adenosine deaminase-related metal-dependent hydrolase
MKLSAFSVVNRLKNMGMLGKKTICAHCVHVDQAELKALNESNTIVVHNPQSNMNNAVGVADTLAFAEYKLLHGLGTDAMTNNMLEELRSAMWIQKLKHQDPSVAFMETVNALCVNNPLIAERFWPGLGLGELKAGNKADIVLIDYFSPNHFYHHQFF